MTDVNASLQVEDNGTPRPLNVDDLSVLPAGAATETTLERVADGIEGTVTVDTGLVIPAPQTDALTDTQLRAAAVPVAVANPTADPETGLAKDATLSARYGGGKTAATAQATAAGDTTVYTPAAGKAVRLFWASAVNDPDATASPRIILKFGTAELYRGYAFAHWEIFTGAVDQPLVVNLDQPGDVAVTVHLQEI